MKYEKLNIANVKLQTRIDVFERNVAVSDIKMEHHEISVDDNGRYSRRHSLRLSGIEKRKYKETPGDVTDAIYNEMDRLEAPIYELEINRAQNWEKYKEENGNTRCC